MAKTSDDIQLVRIGNSDMSDSELRSLRAANFADMNTGLLDGNTGDVRADIGNLAHNLNLTNDRGNYNYNEIAKAMGMNNFDLRNVADCDELKSRLQDKQDELIDNELNSSTHDKANDMRDAYAKTLNNKNYYKDARHENANKQSLAADRRRKAEEAVARDDADKKRIQEAKEKGKYKKPTTPEEKAKEKEDKEKQKQNKKDLKDAKNKEKELKQEEKDLKRDALKAKAFNALHPLEAAKMRARNSAKNAADKAKEKAKDLAKSIWKKIPFKIRLIICIILACIIFFIIMLAFSYKYILMALEALDNSAIYVANTQEKFDNFFNGLGFKDSEEAFFEELNDLNEKYQYELDIPLIMSTLFYDDIHGSNGLGVENTSDSDGSIPLYEYAQSKNGLWEWFKDKYAESEQTIGDDGLIYTSNKVYRLRKLAKHQFTNSLFGTSKNYTTKTVSATEFITDYLERTSSAMETLLDDTGAVMLTMIFSINELFDLIESIIQMAQGTEVFSTTDSGSFIDHNLFTDVLDLFKAMFGSFYEIVDIDITSGEITYIVPTIDEDAYYDYLRNYYIKNMPEFKKYINASTDEKRDEQIEKVITEIKEYVENFKDIFGIEEASTENYSATCSGNIKQSLLGDLQKPVDGSSFSFSGNYAYGISDGVVHKGLDLNSTTAGVSEGDSVYSVYDSGTVIESTADDTYSDSDVNGGWVKIQYTSSSSVESNKFTIVYGGLSKESLTLKKDDLVNKGDVIGTIGNASESEDGKTPSLHFGYYDDVSNVYLDPTNLFISCESGSTAKTYLIHDTNTISEDNFVSAIEEYCVSHSCYTTLQNWDLHSVYKYSVNNNINPTFVVIRGIVEGFSPGGSTYNYWGIGCTNGVDANCKSYSSLADGIAGLASLDIVKNSTSLYDVMDAGYAYIGDYWYNQSDNSKYSGVGGCYYYPYIKQYMSESRSNEVGSVCVTGKWCYYPSSGTCVKTTDEDQEAYIEWQCENQLNYYKEIFGNYITIQNNSYSINGSSTGGSSGSSAIETYLSKMFEMADDDTIVYSQSNRNLDPGVDCSSFVYYALLNSNTIAAEQWASTTQSLGSVLVKNGFTEISFDASILQRGDIVIDPASHATTYIGDGQQVSARSARLATAEQVAVSNFSASAHNYKYIYRLQ